jgi:DNA-binding NtrC family response regulator
VHEASARAAHALVVVDCASLPETLFESELFGHERGAFTGASASKPGLVEAASGGTLFLDEVGDIPLPMQVKLLRLLESGTYRRVGSTELRRTDVRVVAATHRDLKAMVVEGRFREDLYYRLSTFPITLPPLRDRLDDIPMLAVALLARVAPDRRMALSPGAVARLRQHAFPGNVRELRNVLERAALLADGAQIEATHVERALGSDAMPTTARPLAVPSSAPTATVPAEASLRDVERAALQAQLKAHRGSRAELARKLGISERSLYRKLRDLDRDAGG